MVEDIIKKESEIQAYLGLIRLKRGQKINKDGVKCRKSAFQVTVLSEVFKLTGYPSTQTKMDLSLLINLPIQAIQVWFQNERRSRRRRLKKMSNICEMQENEYFEISILTLVNIINTTKARFINNQ
ncbi:Homeobox protein HD-8 [Nosema granulosis]|uniref:Homeobox protein HD-8 n=1 Tax=Nosema granulosis TaxID=83296 RepID=A0A9P6GXW2_9MICR|nr:Homeobox protein HD-8 [Nosema granulosis]